MALYNAGQVLIQSGAIGSSSMVPLQMVNSVSINPSIPRANVGVLNRGKPLEQRPVINYSPVEVSVEFTRNSSSVEEILGLRGATVLSNITDTRGGAGTYAVRNMQVAFAPSNSTNYNSFYDIKSGVLTSYSLQGGVSEPIRGSFSMQCLDMSGGYYGSARDSTNYAASVIKPENQVLTGLSSATSLALTGFGLTGITVQSFSFSLGLSHASVHQLGTKFPTERPLTDASASLQVQGFFEGMNNSLTGLGIFDCGAPAYGTIGLTMAPSCSSNATSTITMINPYFEGMNVNGQVGGFSTFSASFSLPIGPNPNETSDGSVVRIS